VEKGNTSGRFKLSSCMTILCKASLHEAELNSFFLPCKYVKPVAGIAAMGEFLLAYR
jgi:hypothetical protein